MSQSPKRDRETRDNVPVPQDGRQYLDEQGEQRIVKNSPYGVTERQTLGWGNPFQKPRRAVSTAYPSVRLGTSSLNSTPSKDRAMDKLLQQYQKKFTALEHCQPYHRMGDEETWDKWHAMAGKDFVYTVKCNQFLTHMKLLELDDDLRAHIQNFFVDRIPRLKQKFGAALMQLPPQFRMTDDHLARLKAVGAQIPPSVRVAVEFRHASWYCDAVYDVLRSLKWALVATHNHDVGNSPVVDTGAGFMYVRLHGSIAQYGGDYGKESLRFWASAIRRFIAANGPDAPVYFFLNNNESHISALTSSVVDATALAIMLDEERADAVAPAASTSVKAPSAAVTTPSVSQPLPTGAAPAASSTPSTQPEGSQSSEAHPKTRGTPRPRAAPAAAAAAATRRRRGVAKLPLSAATLRLEEPLKRPSQRLSKSINIDTAFLTLLLETHR
jgi:uncharacterized protein YecE (DUF72 family)